MKARIAILFSIAAGLLSPHSQPSALSAPLAEFSYADGAGARDSLPDLRQCGYYLLIRGTIGHSGGSRPGASVGLRGDTLAATVDLYRASEFDPHDWTVAGWTMRVGALGPQAYHVTVSVGGKIRLRRGAQLSSRQEGCAA